MMNKHVVFLGAGASVHAKFPDAQQLKEYICNHLPTLTEAWHPTWNRYVTGRRLGDEWQGLSRHLKNYSSVDAFCMEKGGGAEDVDLVLHMKRAVRLVLSSCALRRARPLLYEQFVQRLFTRPDIGMLPSHPKPQITLVNFNYDGLLGNLLVQKYREHQKSVPSTKSPDPNFLFPILASLAGGFYLDRNSTKAWVTPALTADQFGHHMVHGTIACERNGNGQPTMWMDAALYEMDESMRATHGLIEGWQLRDVYESEPMIHFPWREPDVDSVFSHQYQHGRASLAISTALHFVGLSGDDYLKYSFRRLLDDSLHQDAQKIQEFLLSKAWHIAVASRDEGHRVLQKLAQCWLPQDFHPDERFLQDLEQRTKYYAGFEDWVKTSPLP